MVTQQQQHHEPQKSSGRDNFDDRYNPWSAASDGDLPLLRDSLMLLNLSTTVVEEGRLYTLLHVASSNRQLGIIAWLLTQVSNSERRKFVNSMDREGDTALHYSGGLESARFLVETAYINVHIQNEVGMTALETKQWELNTTMQEESFSEADQDYVDLKETVEYLQWVIASEPVEKS